METSLSIHPELYKQQVANEFTDIGGVAALAEDGEDVLLECENGWVRLSLYTERIVRITMDPAGPPPAVAGESLLMQLAKQPLKLTALRQGDELVIAGGGLRLRASCSPLRIAVEEAATGETIVREREHGMMFGAGGEVVGFKAIEPEDRYHGFGEKAGQLNKRGELLTMWNTDVYAPHNQETDPLYVSIPYFMTKRGARAHGIYVLNTFRMEFRMNGETEYALQAEGGRLDYFVLAGPTPKDVVQQYASLTGCVPLPPKWALGYHQSRYSYETEQEVRELVAMFREKGIPLDAVYLDIHYMNGYRVFTFDGERFRKPALLVRDLKEAGVRIVPIVDPGVKADPEYRVFQEGLARGAFCRYADGTMFYGDVWPGKSAFPDFTDEAVREWWRGLHAFYAELGIEGIWNDMNEPAIFNESKTMDVEVMHKNDGRPTTHRELHNTYGLQMSRATYEGMKSHLAGRRPFVLTRSGFAGIQRYAAVWTGDNRSFWEHLEMSVPMCLNLGLSGVPLCGADVGGFAHDSNGQLLVRWTQLGALLPYFRNHSEMKSIRQEPWVFGAEAEAHVKRYIRFRYVWLPFMYGLFAEASRTGLPVVRPLLLEFPDDPQAGLVQDQFLLGPNVLVAPVVRPDTFVRAVYFPAGRWVNYWTDEVVEGGRHMLVDAPLDTLPLFVRQGSIIVHGSERLNTAEPVGPLTVHLYAGVDGALTYTLYDDDGSTFAYEQGGVYEQRLDVVCAGARVELTTQIVQLGCLPSWTSVRFVLHHAGEQPIVAVNGQPAALKRLDESGRPALWTFELA